MNHPQPESPLSGKQILGDDGQRIGSLLDFWQWSSSTLLDNTMRGMLAEYLVGAALGCVDGRQRVEWDAYDLETTDGIKLEVKSSAYLQSWTQEKPSTIQFSIAERSAWFHGTNTYSAVASRRADVYVFCVFTELDRQVANPLDTRQWTFLVTSTAALNAAVAHQKSIRLGPLRERVQPIETTFAGLARAVCDAGPAPAQLDR